MGKKSSKSTTGPSKFSQPYITQAANVLQNDYQRNAGSVQDIAAIIQSGIPGVARKAFGSDPLLASARRYNGEVLAGQYLGDDPRLEAMVARVRDDTTDRVGARFGALGGYGGTRYADALGRGLADSELGLRYQNYRQERDAMAAAAGLAPDLVGAEYAGIAPLLALAGGGLRPQAEDRDPQGRRVRRRPGALRVALHHRRRRPYRRDGRRGRNATPLGAGTGRLRVQDRRLREIVTRFDTGFDSGDMRAGRPTASPARAGGMAPRI